MLSSPPLQQSVCSDKERGVVVGPFLHTSPPFWHALAAPCYRCFVCLFLEKIHLIWKDSSDFRVYGKHSLKAHSGILSTGLFGFYSVRKTWLKSTFWNPIYWTLRMILRFYNNKFLQHRRNAMIMPITTIDTPWLCVVYS